jgi:hypothetical protein
MTYTGGEALELEADDFGHVRAFKTAGDKHRSTPRQGLYGLLCQVLGRSADAVAIPVGRGLEDMLVVFQ